MIAIILICVAILILLAGVAFAFFVVEDDTSSIFTLSICSVISIFLLIAAAGTLSDEPKAIEVYQGKTTLEYTIIDNIKTDSVVVYKNRIK